MYKKVSELRTIKVLKSITSINIIAHWGKNERTFSDHL